jgi:hypothetical protein
MSCLGGGYGAGTWFCNIADGGRFYAIPVDFDNKEMKVTKYR